MRPRAAVRKPAGIAMPVAVACLALACSETGPRPDVVLVTVDTLRADRLGAYGSPLGATPNIDALAAQGVVFERAIAASGRTAPSHASIFTSRYVRGHSIGFRNGDSALRGEPVLAERFAEAGYATGAFVGNLLLAGRLGFARGFDVYDDELHTPEANRPHVVERRARDTTDRALAWLEAHDRAAFLWVHYQDPHGPHTPPADFVAPAGRCEVPAPAGEPALSPGGRGRTTNVIPRYQLLPGLRRPSAYEARYCGEIAYADREIGRLLAAIDARGRPSIVLLTADHGESLGEGGHYFKHTHATTPDVAHVPFILRAPGLSPQRRDGLVSHVDVLPTLLELAGLPAAGDREGLALGRLLREGAPLPDRHVFCDHGIGLSAYAGDGFHDVGDVAAAWHEPAASVPAQGARYVWRPDGSFERVEGAAALPPEVRRYAARATPMVVLPRPSEAQRARLRALGYAD